MKSKYKYRITVPNSIIWQTNSEVRYVGDDDCRSEIKCRFICGDKEVTVCAPFYVEKQLATDTGGICTDIVPSNVTFKERD